MRVEKIPGSGRSLLVLHDFIRAVTIAETVYVRRMYSALNK